MRPAGRGPLDSLYFTYPKFAARHVPERASTSERVRVAIVGAGPIGMTAALTLARHGVESVLLDAKDTFNDGSRATCIARQSMQILQQVGAVEPFVAHALGWTHGRSFYRGEQILRFEMPHSDNEKYLPMYNLQQQYTEKYLHDAVVACSDLIDMRWCSEVTGVATSGDGATLKVKTAREPYDLAADYVLAADGARSPVRSMLGLRLKGANYEGNYVIADVRMAHDYPTERRAFFDPAGNPGGTVLIHKQPDDIWRIDYQLREGETAEEATRESSIRERVQAILGDIGHTGTWELEWWSTYTANTLCLDDYRHGRVFFIGDSAHIVPIFGVRGLNNGLADAQNIGWKLAYVLNGQAGEALLDSYSPERRGATLDVFANATKSTRFMTPPSRGWTLAREAALSLALQHDWAGKLADPRQMTPYTYGDSPLTLFASRDGEFSAGPISGSAASNVQIAPGDYLLDRAGDGFTAVVFLDRGLDVKTGELLDALTRLDPGFTALIVAMQGSTVTGAAIEDRAGALASAYDAVAGTAYLLRPDLHVAGRWKTADAGEIVRTLDACLGTTGLGDKRGLGGTQR
jgi:3-(3-hydroxy-phenyl)propionate hydroxylase